jgi:hypothetical protein
VSLLFLVVRGVWSGQVPVGLDLWRRDGPIVEPRLLFWGRPRAWRGERERLGRVSGNGQHWDLEDPAIEERWNDEQGHHVRHRLELIAPFERHSVGALFWVETEQAG